MAQKPPVTLPSREEIAALREQNLALQARVDALELRQPEPALDGVELENPLETFTEIIESMRDGVALFDAKDRFVFGNASFRAYLGATADHLKPGVSFEEIVRARVKGGFILNAAPDPEAWSRERMDRHRRGDIHTTHIRSKDAHTILLTEHKVGSGGTVIVRTDITDQINAEEAHRQSEERFRAAFENSIVGISLVSRDYEDSLYNPAFCNMLGYTPEELRGIRLQSLLHPSNASIGQQRRAEFESGENTSSVDLERFVHKTGGDVWIETSRAPIFDDDGKLSYVMSIRQNITERKLAEEAQRQSEERFHAAFENSIIGISLISRDYKDRHFNRAFYEMLGYTLKEIEGLRLHELLHPDAQSIGPQRRAAFESREKKFSVDIEQFLHKNGSTVWCETSRAPVFDSDGNLSYIIAIRQDITERKLAEEALHESESIFGSVFENTDIGITIRSPDRKLRLFNPAICEMLGYTTEEFDHINLGDLAHPDDADKNMDHMIGEGEKSTAYERRFRHNDGHYVWYHVSASLLYNDDGSLRYRVALLRDITDRMASEMALRASEELFRSAFENGGVGVILRSLDGKTRRVNQAFLDLIGYSDAELRSMTFNDFTHPDDLHDKMRIANIDLEKTPHQTLLRRLIHKDVRIVHTLINRSLVRDGDGKPSHTISFCQDLSEQVKGEEQLRDSEAKFRSIFENTEIGITVTSQDRSLRLFNPAICQILG